MERSKGLLILGRRAGIRRLSDVAKPGFSAFSAKHPHKPQDIVVEVDTAQDVDAGVSDCAAACANLELLGCDGAEGSPGLDEEYGTSDDVPCDQVCRETEAGGIPMHTACVAAAGSCDAVDECFD